MKPARITSVVLALLATLLSLAADGTAQVQESSSEDYSTRYNRLWDGWIKNNRSANKKRVRAYARRMHLKYLDKYAKPGPGGCKVYTCVIDPVPEV